MNMKKLLALLLSLMMLTGCCSAFAESTASEDEGDVVIAYVNGEAVTLSLVTSYYESIVSYYGYDSTDDATATELYPVALQTAIGYTLMHQKAVEMGLTEVTDEELATLTATVHEDWQSMLLYYAEAYFGYSEDGSEETNNDAIAQTVEFLASYGYTEETILADEIDNLWYNRLTAIMVADVQATDEQARAMFDSLVEEDRAYFEGNVMMYEFYTVYYGYTSYYMPEGYRGVKQILLEADEDLLATWSALNESLSNGEEGVTQEDVDLAANAVIASVQDKITDIYTRLDAGESFDTLIAEYNTDPGMSMEPYATNGYDVAMDSIMYDMPFVNAAFSVDTIGQVSQPYVGEYGIYIVCYVRDVPAGAVEYTDDIRAEMLEEAQSSLESDAIDAVVDAWIAEAEIVYTDAASVFLAADDAATVGE